MKTERKRQRHGRAQNLLLLGCSVLLALAAGGTAGEMILRKTVSNEVYVKEHAGFWRGPNNQFDPELGWAPIPSARRQFSWGTVTLNSLGFRSPEIDPQKETMVLLGDSVIFGEMADDSEIASAQLQEMLKETNWQLQNLGVSGYGIGQEYLYLMRMIDRIPNVKKVILVLCSKNDLADTASNVTAGKRKPLFVIEDHELKLTGVPIRKYCLRNVLSQSLLLYQAGRFFPPLEKGLSRLAGDRVFYGRKRRKLVRRLISQIRFFLQERGIPLEIVVTPSRASFPSQTPSEKWLRTCAATLDVPVIDFYRVIDRESRHPRSLFADFVHFNPEGHRLLARTMYKRFFEAG